MKTKNILPAISLALATLFVNIGTAIAYPSIILETSLNDGNGPGRLESLSGINIIPVKQNGTFQLQFNNEIKENGVIELSNSNGKVIFSKPISEVINPETNSMNVGKLNSGIYLIEVKTGNTIYWKKVRIRK